MSSPIPPDPYSALGVAKDADTSAIRIAHRKLVLKHHPDRIQDAALKEKGKNEFQKIQQAYELLSDPVKRSRYDDRIKLAELRKEAMMRGDSGPRPTAYPTRHAAPPTPSGREYREEDQRYYEERKPREPKESYFDSKEKFDEPIRSSSRKYPDYERRSAPTKSSEKERSETKAGNKWNVAYAAVNFGIKVKNQTEQKKSKGYESKQETRDREKRRARKEKEEIRRPFVVDDAGSDSDTATGVSGVTESTIRPSKPSPRYSREPEFSSKRSSGASRHRAYSEDDSDNDTMVSRSTKYENLYEQSMHYISKSGNTRPEISRVLSNPFWAGIDSRRSGSDSERRPTSSKGRRSYEEMPSRPPMPTQSSAPGNLKPRVEERSPNQRRSATGSSSAREKERSSDHRKEAPSLGRSQTMPSPRSSAPKKDNVPSKGSGLKHGETHDSGYGSSSSPHTPEMREESPIRRPKQTSTRYAYVDPQSASEEDVRRPRFIVLDDEADRHRRYRSPEHEQREPERRREKDQPRRPRVNTHVRSGSSRDMPTVIPSMRRAESNRFEPRSPRESPPISRNNSAREKLFAEVSPDDRDGSRHKYGSAEKVNLRSPYQDPKMPSYARESSGRGYDNPHGSRFQEGLRNPESRRPSVQGH